MPYLCRDHVCIMCASCGHYAAINATAAPANAHFTGEDVFQNGNGNQNGAARYRFERGSRLAPNRAYGILFC